MVVPTFDENMDNMCVIMNNLFDIVCYETGGVKVSLIYKWILMNTFGISD